MLLYLKTTAILFVFLMALNLNLKTILVETTAQYPSINKLTTFISVLNYSKISRSYQRLQTGSVFIINLPHKEMAYLAFIYSYHTESHLFKTKININPHFIGYSL